MSKTTIPTGGLADAAVTTAKITDANITTAKIADDAVTAAKATGIGITMVDQWRYTTTTQGNVSPITSNLERIDGTAQGTFGSSLMSESSGIFTFPSTGIYLVRLDVGAYINNAKDRTWGAQVQITNDNSNYNELALASGNLFDSDDNTTETIGCQTLIDVTNTTNIKVRFAVFF